MHRRMVMVGGMLLGVIACASGESSAEGAAGAGARDPATVAASPPLPGFSADVPAGRIPGSAPTPAGSTAGTAAGAATSPPAPAGSAAPARPAPTGTAPTGAAPTGGRAVGAGSTGAAPVGAATTTASPSSSGATLAPGEISAASGVFTTAQAERGREVYTNSCARCHMASAHSGGTFASTWNGRRVSDLYELLYSTMPLDAPASLTEQQYVDVVAYMLQLNGHRAGSKALTPDPAELRKVRIDIRSTAGLQ